MSYIYNLYGKIVESDFEFQDLQISQDKPKLQIKQGDVPIEIRKIKSSGLYFQNSDDELLLTIPNIAQYWIKNKSEIIIKPLPDSEIEDIQIFLLGTVMGIYNQKQGNLPIHGACLRNGDHNFLICGPCGSGKSTLAYSFMKLGYQILSDDVTIFSKKKNKTQIFSGPPYLKLWKETVKNFKIEKPLKKIRKNVDKFYFPIRKSMSSELENRISNIYIVLPTNSKIMSYLKPEGVEKLKYMISNIYRYRFVLGTKWEQQMIKNLSEILNNTNITVIKRPRHINTVSEVVQYIYNENR